MFFEANNLARCGSLVLVINNHQRRMMVYFCPLRARKITSTLWYYIHIQDINMDIIIPPPPANEVFFLGGVILFHPVRLSVCPFVCQIPVCGHDFVHACSKRWLHGFFWKFVHWLLACTSCKLDTDARKQTCLYLYWFSKKSRNMHVSITCITLHFDKQFTCQYNNVSWWQV